MHVQEIMTQDVKCCRPQTRLNDAGWQMWEQDCGILPVLNDNDRLAGIITDRDICMAVATRPQTAADIRVADAMSRDVVTCSPTDGVNHALQLMRHHALRRLPVVDKHGALRGMLSINDLILHATDKPGHGGIAANDIVTTLKAICTHRDLLAARSS